MSNTKAIVTTAILMLIPATRVIIVTVIILAALTISIAQQLGMDSRSHRRRPSMTRRKARA